MAKRMLSVNNDHGIVRLRRRRMLTIENFNLFNLNRGDASMVAVGGMSLTAEPAFLTDEEKFMRSAAD